MRYVRRWNRSPSRYAASTYTADGVGGTVLDGAHQLGADAVVRTTHLIGHDTSFVP